MKQADSRAAAQSPVRPQRDSHGGRVEGPANQSIPCPRSEHYEIATPAEAFQIHGAAAQRDIGETVLFGSVGGKW